MYVSLHVCSLFDVVFALYGLARECWYISHIYTKPPLHAHAQTCPVMLDTEFLSISGYSLNAYACREGFDEPSLLDTVISTKGASA